ncbi:MAG: helix-turn-helix domain-containing protein [Pseudomonadota bacterium]
MKTPRRTQAERRAETRALLLRTARRLFLEKGYDRTGMPELVKEAGLTRGALYHHFDDKRDLFLAIAKQDAESIGQHIDAATREVTDPEEAMSVGTQAYFDAMAVPGRAQILLSLAPAILGSKDAKALTAQEGSAELRDGLANAMPDIDTATLDALTDVLSAAFDRAGFEIAHGADREAYTKALFHIIGSLLASPD